jgi:Rieske Fe-S protein
MVDVQAAPPVDQPATKRLMQRRRFLKWLIRLGYGAFALAFVMPALALRTLTREEKGVAAGDQLVFALGDRAGSPVTLDNIPVNSAVQVFPEGKTENQDNLIQLIHIDDQSDQPVVAYSAICTHLGCSVLAQLNENGNIVCPCHGSVFDPSNGAEVVRGPAGRPLPSLPVQVEADGTIVATGDFDTPVGPD